MTPEGELKKAVQEWLTVTGAFYLRLNSGKVRVKGGWLHLAPEGTADYVVFTNPPTWIELKAPGCKTAKERVVLQAAFRDKVLSCGHRHAQCETLEQVKDALA